MQDGAVTRAFTFPGQGAQTVGMGTELAEAYPAARRVFEAVDEALGERLSRLIREGPQDELTLTANAQPALMATSMAAMAALESEGVTVEAAAFVAGHSLGEYSALCAARALALGDTARGRVGLGELRSHADRLRPLSREGEGAPECSVLHGRRTPGPAGNVKAGLAACIGPC